jgi:hypothetical protein
MASQGTWYDKTSIQIRENVDPELYILSTYINKPCFCLGQETKWFTPQYPSSQNSFSTSA